jgi:hypothetical protein
MRVLICPVALALLAACGDSAGSAAPAAADQGEVVIEDAGGAQAALPEGFTLPAGTQIVSNQQVTAPGGEGRIVLLDSSSALESHFRAEAEAAGFEVSVDTNASGFRQLAGRRADGMQFDFAASTDGDGVTRGSLAMGRNRRQ